MKFLTIVSCGLVAFGIATPAGADAFGWEMGFRPLVQRQVQGRRQAQEAAARRGEARSMPQQNAPGAEENDRGRMSPEERRQLRRDIQDAGKDKSS